MACALTTGGTLDCKNQVGGGKEIFFAPWDILNNSITYGASGEVTDFDAATLYRYEGKGAQLSFNQEVTANGDNNGVFYTQTVEFTLPDMTYARRSELMRMIQNRRLVIFIRDNHNTIYMVGIDQGAEVTAGTVGVGGAYADLRGAKLTFTAECRELAPMVEQYTTNPFDNIATATVSPAY